MITYTKEELKHHKWRLIQGGMTPDEAKERIQHMVEFTDEVHKRVIEKKQAKRNEVPDFSEEFKKLLGVEK